MLLRLRIKDVFAPTLLAEGYCCPDERLLCWYRIVNGEMLNSVCFYHMWAAQPFFVNIGCGTHPLFAKPVYFSRAVYSRDFLDAARFREFMVHTSGGNGGCFYDLENNNIVFHPNTPERGLEFYRQDAKPWLDKASTIASAYALHKEYIKIGTPLPDVPYQRKIPSTVISEAIYVEDTSVWDACKVAVQEDIAYNKKWAEAKPQNTAFSAALELAQWQYRALNEGDRAGFLQYLEREKEKNIKYIRRYIGLEIVG